MDIHSLLPTAIVIFGGTGDLARTKLFPALFHLYLNGQLPEQFTIVGLSRKELLDDEYQAFARESIVSKGHAYDEYTVATFLSHIRYTAGSFDAEDTYERIKEMLRQYDTEVGQQSNKLFYLAVPPQYYEVIFEHLAKSNAMALADGKDSWSRLLVEKPFGRDLKTAQALEKKLCSLFLDEQIYRIDHYLAKDAIENIVALRFANSVLGDSWNSNAIESIHIKLIETKDVSNRGSFYDDIGTLRDVGQNHLLQIFALLTMPPADIHYPQAVRRARAQALKALEAHEDMEIVRGQYEGYGATSGVATNSETETYFKLSFTLKDHPWSGARVILEAGKAMAEQVNEAVITFRPHDLCRCDMETIPHHHRNTLHITFSPKQHIYLSMWMKAPGFSFILQEERLTLASREGENSTSREAYERVLFDCITGDQTRFVSGEEVELAWHFITPILERFKTIPLLTYTHGSTGPIITNT